MSETSESGHPSPQSILKKPHNVGTKGKSPTDPCDSALQIPLHPGPFKLRFAPRRDLGRSYVSLVKPLGLEATATQKFHTRQGEGASEVTEEHVDRVFERIQGQFERGPRQKYAAPVTGSQEYGWWWDTAAPILRDRRLNHHIRDSHWLKSQVAILAADQKLKYR